MIDVLRYKTKLKHSKGKEKEGKESSRTTVDYDVERDIRKRKVTEKHNNRRICLYAESHRACVLKAQHYAMDECCKLVPIDRHAEAQESSLD